MSALDPTSFSDKHAYGYLVAFKQTHIPFEKAGDVLIADLTYWNSTDIDSSKEKAATFAWGLHQSCIQNASVWGVKFLGDANQHSKAMTALVTTMQTPTKSISDIAKGLHSLFSFTA